MLKECFEISASGKIIVNLLLMLTTRNRVTYRNETMQIAAIKRTEDVDY
jgi:hypothetical protein